MVDCRNSPSATSLYVKIIEKLNSSITNSKKQENTN